MAVDMFLKLDGIKGESADAKHKGEIDIESFSWGISNTGSAGSGQGGGGAGRASFQDFSFVAPVNAASPLLALAAAAGTHIKEAILTARRAGEKQQEFLVVKVSDVLVSGYQQGGVQMGQEVVTESFSLSFSKIEYEYRGQNDKGQVTPLRMAWDLRKNQKI